MNTLTEPTEINTDPDSVIDKIQRYRLALLDNEAELDKLTLQLLADTAATAIATKRIEVDTNISKSDQEVSAAITTFLKKVTDNPFAHTNNTTNVTFNPPHLDNIVIVPDETLRGLVKMEYTGG